MKYIPGFKFTINGTIGGIKQTIFNNGSKLFVKSPIEGILLNVPCEILFIKPVKEDGVIKNVKYSFIQYVNGRHKQITETVFNSIKEAEDIIDSIIQCSSNPTETNPPVSSNLQQRLRERIPLSSNQIRNHRKR